MKNPKTTLGGALSAAGSSVAALATVSALADCHRELAMWFIVAGGLLSAAGKFFGLLWAADAPDKPQA